MATMFETGNFRTQLTDTIAREAGNSGLTEYENGAVGFLQDLARSNESTLMEAEVRKIASQRRGIPDAITSAREVAKLASSYAVAENRKVLTRADMEKAYRAKFGIIWPFCNE